MTASRNTIILIILGLVVVAAALYLLFGKGDNAAAVLPADAPATETELTFLNLTAEIEPISFDTSVLSDPRFMALVDIRTAIVPETTGRTDPFAPLGAP